MDTERIVRALAAKDAPRSKVDDLQCGLCEEYIAPLEEHAADCPWRLAVEWVAANPG